MNPFSLQVKFYTWNDRLILDTGTLSAALDVSGTSDEITSEYCIVNFEDHTTTTDDYVYSETW